MPKFLIIYLVFALPGFPLTAQQNRPSEFISPLAIPLFLSGNFGELRSNHFHAGIDIKTEGVTGKPVLASDEGFISRIKIQSGGYGNSLYLTHPNGYTTVYAHLDHFIPEIQAYVENQQYRRESFEIELFPGSTQFVFAQGEVIAYSGNSGRSGGPHLHFEIRKTNGQTPQNGLLYNFPIADNQKPVFRNLYVYSFPDPEMTGNNGERRTGYALVRKYDSLYSIPDVVTLNDTYIGFGTEIYDFLNGSTNKCGVYRMEQYVNGSKTFSFSIDAISFSHTRYINAHMDYELKSSEGKSVHRLFRLPNNQLPIYRTNDLAGLLKPVPDSLYHIRIVASDAYGNKTALEFNARMKEPAPPVPDKKSVWVDWTEGSGIRAERFNISIPPSALYRSVFMDVRAVSTNENPLEDTLYLHYESEPLYKTITVETELPAWGIEDPRKLVLVHINAEGEASSVGGEIYGKKLIATTRTLGRYVLMIDTLAPVIGEVSYNVGQNYRAGQRIQFKAEDELSGIAGYRGTIDGKWALFRYDAKSGLLTYTIDADRLEKGRVHTLLLEVTDEKENTASYAGEFIY